MKYSISIFGFTFFFSIKFKMPEALLDSLSLELVGYYDCYFKMNLD